MISQVRKCLRLLPNSLKLSLAVFGTGIASGLVGIFCHYLLEFIQVLAFGKDKESLLLQFQSVNAFRRLSVLLVVGVLSSLFWYFLQRHVTILSISKAKKLVGKRSPNFLGQSLHALIQVAIVAAGASIGKEGAPRELGALFGGSLSKELNLDISDRQLLIACGAGSGLASVYQVPFASALFVLETLGVSWTLKNIIIIFATTYVSAYCAKPIVGGHTLYTVDKVTIDSSSFIQAIILALFVTPLAIIFGYLAKKASKHRITGKEILWTLPFTFMILGVLSAYLPIFMGNGQVLAQWIFSGNSSAYLPVILIIKCLLVCLLLSSGAYGGTLTPSFALGVGSGYLITVLLGNFGFSHSLSLGMLLGATIFLGTTLNAPLTGIALVVGFTGTAGVIVFPLILASILSRIISNKWKERV